MSNVASAGILSLLRLVAINRLPLSKALCVKKGIINLNGKPLEHPIISSVIAGIVLWALAWMGGVMPLIWQWLTEAVTTIYNFFTEDIPIPLWLLIIISTPIILWLYNLISSAIKSENDNPIIQSGDVSIVAEEDDTITLSQREERVMLLFIEADGKSIKPDHLTYRLNTSTLKIEQVLEALVDKGLIEAYRNIYHGTSFGLTRIGRDFMMGNEFENT